MTDQAKPTARKKSQKRQRKEQIKTPLTTDEFNRVAARAAALGLSKAAFSRLKMLDETGERSQHVLPVNAELVREAIAEMGRYGNNVNQLAYKANAHDELPMERELRALLARHEAVLDMLMTAIGKGAQTPA